MTRDESFKPNTTSGDGLDSAERQPILPRIGIVAIADAGRCMLPRLVASLPTRTGTVEINTYAAHATDPHICANQTILIGDGVGSLPSPKVVREIAISHLPAIRAAISCFDIVIIIAAMDGSTGTGVAPFVAEVARRAGVFTIGAAILPLSVKGHRQQVKASLDFEAFQRNCDAALRLANACFDLNAYRNSPLDLSLDDIAETVFQLHECVRRTIAGDGPLALAFEDLRLILTKTGTAALGFAKGSIADPIDDIALLALAHPLLGLHRLKQARGVVVSIGSRPNTVKLSHSQMILNAVRMHVHPDAQVAYATHIDSRLKHDVEIAVLATGIPNVSMESSV